MKRFIALAMILSLSGCASVKVKEPVEQSFDRSQTYKLPFDKVWIRAVDWFADHNVTIDKIEKPSGLITGKYPVRLDDLFLDCGEIKTSGFLGTPMIEKYGIVNLTVRSISDSETKLNVNLFGEFRVEGNDSWDGRFVKYNGRCVSTGTLEKSVMSYITE